MIRGCDSGNKLPSGCDKSGPWGWSVVLERLCSEPLVNLTQQLPEAWDGPKKVYNCQISLMKWYAIITMVVVLRETQ